MRSRCNAKQSRCGRPDGGQSCKHIPPGLPHLRAPLDGTSQGQQPRPGAWSRPPGDCQVGGEQVPPQAALRRRRASPAGVRGRPKVFMKRMSKISASRRARRELRVEQQNNKRLEPRRGKGWCLCGQGPSGGDPSEAVARYKESRPGSHRARCCRGPWPAVVLRCGPGAAATSRPGAASGGAAGSPARGHGGCGSEAAKPSCACQQAAWHAGRFQKPVRLLGGAGVAPLQSCW